MLTSPAPKIQRRGGGRSRASMRCAAFGLLSSTVFKDAPLKKAMGDFSTSSFPFLDALRRWLWPLIRNYLKNEIDRHGARNAREGNPQELLFLATLAPWRFKFIKAAPRPSA